MSFQDCSAQAVCAITRNYIVLTVQHEVKMFSRRFETSLGTVSEETKGGTYINDSGGPSALSSQQIPHNPNVFSSCVLHVLAAVGRCAARVESDLQNQPPMSALNAIT